MKYVSLTIAVLAILAAFRFLTLTPAVDPCNPPCPQGDAVAIAPVPGAPMPTLAPARPPQIDPPAHVFYVTVEAELQPETPE